MCSFSTIEETEESSGRGGSNPRRDLHRKAAVIAGMPEDTSQEGLSEKEKIVAAGGGGRGANISRGECGKKRCREGGFLE